MPAARARTSAGAAAGADKDGGADLTRALAAHLRSIRHLAQEAAAHRDLALAAACAATRDAHFELARGYLARVAALRAAPGWAGTPQPRAAASDAATEGTSLRLSENG